MTRPQVHVYSGAPNILAHAIHYILFTRYGAR